MSNPETDMTRVLEVAAGTGVVTRTLASVLPDIAPAKIDTVAARSRAQSSRVPAIAYCQGTPLRNEIEARGPSRLGEATDLAADAIAGRFGREAVEGKMQAHIVTIEAESR